MPRLAGTILASGPNLSTLSLGSTLGLLESPASDISSITEGRIVQVWQLILSSNAPAIDGHTAINLAWLKGMPQRGTAYVNSYTGASNGVSTTLSGASYHPSLFAYEFRAYTPRPIDGKRVWEIEVIYREPIWGNDEYPGTARQPPALRNCEYRFDFVDIQFDEAEAYKISSSGAKASDFNSKQTVTHTNGQPLDRPLKVTRKSPVVDIWFNTYDQTLSTFIMLYFDNKLNSDEFNLFGYPVGKYEARVLLAEQEQAGYYSGSPYYRVHVQMMLAPDPSYHWVQVPSVGNINSLGLAITSEDGHLRGNAGLQENGEPADSSNPPAVLKWSTLGTRPFNSIVAGEGPLASGWLANLRGKLG